MENIYLFLMFFCVYFCEWIDFTCPLFTTTGHVNCRQDQFTCKSGNQCLAGYQECDGVLDCYDGSDESPDICRKFTNILHYEIYFVCTASSGEYIIFFVSRSSASTLFCFSGRDAKV